MTPLLIICAACLAPVLLVWYIDKKVQRDLEEYILSITPPDIACTNEDESTTEA